MTENQHQSVRAKTRVNSDKGNEYISYLVEITLIQHTIPLLNTLKIDCRTNYFRNSTYSPKYFTFETDPEKLPWSKNTYEGQLYDDILYYVQGLGTMI